MTESLIYIFSGNWGFLWVTLSAVILSLILTVILALIPQEILDKWDKEEKEYQPKNSLWFDIFMIIILLAVIIGLTILCLSQLNQAVITCANCTSIIN